MILFAKFIHVLCAIFFLGFGLGSFFYKWVGVRTKDPRVVRFCDEHIVFADWIFTVPSGLLLPLTGLYLARSYGLPLTTGFAATGIAGFLIAGITWLPAAWLQVSMRRMARAADDSGTPLPAQYFSAMRAWTLLGVPSFAAALVTVWAMVTKQSLF